MTEDKPLSDPIKADVLKSLYRRDDRVVTGVRFTYASGETHMRFILSGLWPESEMAIPRFIHELVSIVAHVTPAFHESVGKEVWVFAAERSWLAEFIALTAADLQRASVDSVTLLDRDLNCVLRLLTGHPVATMAAPYADMRSAVSVTAVMTAVDLPRSYARLDVRDLTETMQAIVRTAVEVYESWLRLLVCFRDGGPRLLLTFAANVPSTATSVLLNLESIEREVHAGLTLDTLKRAVDVIQ
jgi:hypothetical protein